MRNYIMLLAIGFVVLLSGCASVPMANSERDNQAKKFAVKPGLSNIYVYRNESMGAAVKMDVELDGKLVGQTMAKSYFALEVLPGKHTLISKAENDSILDVNAEAGKNYFVWQEVKMGLLYARNKLQLVEEAIGKSGVAESKLIESALTTATPPQAVLPAPKTLLATPPTAPFVAQTSSDTLPAQSESVASKLRALNALYKDGVINQNDFETKKQEILKSM